MQDPLTLKLIIVAMAATFVAVIIALILSYRISRQLMDHNANLARQIHEGNHRQDHSFNALVQAETQLATVQRERDAMAQELVDIEHRLKLAEDKLIGPSHFIGTSDLSSQLLNKEIETVSNVAQMSDQQLMDWIDSKMDEMGLHLKAGVTLKEIAAALGLTQRRVMQAIKTRRDDNTLAEYLTTKRLMTACRLLTEQPHWTIDAVAHDAGFGGTTTFRTIFRKRFGMSPKQYREKKRLVEDSQEEQ